MLEKIQKYETELWTVLCVLFFNIIAHGYRFVNLMFNGDSLLIYQTDQNWKYSIGRIFQPFYWKLRGDLVAPMLIATLAVFYFTAALVLIVRMFKLQNKLQIALLCALLAVNITTTSTFATDFHEGDTYMLALLCATVGVAFFRKAHPVLGGVFICLCLGFYQAYLQLAIGLLILLFMQDLLEGKDPSKVFLSGLKSIAMLLGGSIAYALIMRVLLHVKGIVLADHYNGLTNVGDYSNTSIPRLVVDTYLYVIKEWWNPQTFRSRFVGLANVALLLLAAATLLWLLAAKIKQNRTLLLLIVLFLLFPFGINVVYFISKGMEHTLMTFSFSLLYLLAVLFLREIPHSKAQKYLRYAAYAAMGLGIWCNVIYANQSYLKVALEEKATDALMVRVVGRLEQTEGYVPGETPIAVVGLLPTSPLYKTMDGFEDVRGRTADAYTVSWENTYYLYMENVLNYPVKRSYLTKDDQAAVDAMPTFPADGCCAFIGDTLVVKVGSVVVTDLQ